MIYYTFNTEQEALEVEKHIVDNIKNWVSVNSPESLTENGEALKGRNAKTGNLVESAITNKWAIPEKTKDGIWVFLKPTQEKLLPIPIDIILNGLNAQETEYDINWFSVEQNHYD